MIKQYFKQAWQLIKQNKLFSTIYIAGTALGISMVMVLAILNYVKTANIYPETNRDKTLYVKSLCLSPKDVESDRWQASGGFSYTAIQQFFLTLKTPELVSVEMEPNTDLISLPNDDEMVEGQSRFVDVNYWKVFNFVFLSGKPFSEAEFQSGLNVAVITSSLAKTLFGNEDAVGKEIEYGFKPYRITGVVRDVSYAMPGTYAQIWMPFTSFADYDEAGNAEYDGVLGDVGNIYLLAYSKNDFSAIRTEVGSCVARYNAQSKTWRMDLLGQPDEKSVEIHRQWSNEGPNMVMIRTMIALIVLLLLMIPAINLSGMNSMRMERRMGEMGVRKAFGASRMLLLKQVLIENLLLTGIGGFVGLLLSYIFIWASKKWVFDLGTHFIETMPNETSFEFSFSMLFSFKIFFMVVLACLAMNLLSAFVPVFRSLRKSIVNSLHIKYN
ncbi:MAG TPA: ABC transporter permease [Perlabentimonas sp.]|nr:ABC transporter permease [Perlabentimonas sp.]